MTKRKSKGPSGGRASSIARLPAGPGWWCGMRDVEDVVFDDAPDGVVLVAWLCEDGLVAGAAPVPRGPGLADRVLRSALAAMHEPAAGPPRRPRVIHVEDAEVARVLKGALGPAVRVVREASPDHVESFLDALIAQLDEGFEEPELSPEIERELLDAGHVLHALAPWSCMELLDIHLSCDDGELDGRHVVLVDASPPGFIVFERDSVMSVLSEPDSPVPLVSSGRTIGLSFEPPESEAGDLEEGEPSIEPAPSVRAIEEGRRTAATEDDAAVVTTVARAITALFRDHSPALVAGETFEAAVVVPHRGRRLEIQLDVIMGDPEIEKDEIDQLESEAEMLEEWLELLLDEAGVELDPEAAVAQRAWVGELAPERRSHAMRLLDRLALVLGQIDEVAEDLV